MKKTILLLLAMALGAIQCPAQSILAPFSWTTIAGSFSRASLTNGYGGFADGTNGDAQFGAPFSVAVDLAGNVYVGDAANYAIREATPAGTNWVVTTLAVLPSPASLAGPGFGTLSFNPLGVAVDIKGNVYVADSYYNAIREITPDGTVTTLAGNPSLTNAGGFQLGGYLDGPGGSALLNYPTSVAVDHAGNLYVADSGNNVVRKISLPPGGAGWQVTTLAGNPGFGYKDGTGTNAQFYGPAAVAVDGGGNVYVADFSNNMIRKVSPQGAVTTLAGQLQTIGPFQGVPYGNADGPGATAQFYYPQGVAVDAATNVYVADTYNSEIRKVTPQGVVTTLGGKPGFNLFFNPITPVGDYQDGSDAVARFNAPTGVAADSAGHIYVADDGNFVIRQGAPPKVQALAMEVTQVIQDWSNSVPLIQGKETYVRVHLQLPPHSPPVVVSGAQLYGAGPNGPLPHSPVVPINLGGALTVQNYDATDSSVRGFFTNSLNFRLPPEWLSGPVTLRCAWSGGLEPANVLTTDCMAQVTFVPAAVPQIRFFDIIWTNAAGARSQVGATLYDLPRRVQSCYPVAAVGATFGALHYSTAGPPGFEEVNSALGVSRCLDALLGELYSNPLGNTIYFGAITTNGGPPPGEGTILGLAADIPSFVSSSLVPAGYGFARQTVSHELGHNLGRQHDVSVSLFNSQLKDGTTYANGACNELGLLTYTYPLFQIFGGQPRPTLGPIVEGDNNSLIYGLDALTLKTAPAMEPVLSPVVDSDSVTNWYFDLMSYCASGGPEDFWPSSVTYPALLASNNAIFGPPAAPTLSRLGAAGGNYLLARGTVDFNAGAARFLPCLELAATHAPAASAPGTNFLLEALDVSGAVLQSVPFALNPSAVEGNDTNQTADFFVLLNDNPAIQTLKLSYEGVLSLATLTASPHAPTLTLTTPNGGQNFGAGAVNVAWSGHDADGDPLAYAIQYSPNGGATWQTIAVDWTGQSIELDSSELAETTNGLMRVVASDGFHSTTVQSASPFIVQPHAPRVNINSPQDGAVFIADQQLFLDATAFDPQDGQLNGTNVQWSSDLDGALGGGAIVTFDATSLSEGYHTITVTATDSAGLSGSAVIHLLELQFPPPQLSIQVSPGIAGIAPPFAALSWPSYYDNYVLQSSASLTSGWSSLTNNPPSVQADQQVVNLGLSGARSFYRLLFQP